MNIINKTKIDWCDFTWNPVWGCENKCEYCYARKIAKRFAFKKAVQEANKNYFCDSLDAENEYIGRLENNLYDFKVSWLESNFNKKFPVKSSRIFVNSMSDISFWKTSWIERILKKIEQYPQHEFLFLTKTPEIYLKINAPKNCYFGITLNNHKNINSCLRFIMMNNNKNKLFISFEPLQENINCTIIDFFDWVIIGAETGNRKNKIITKKEWVNEIVNYCRLEKVPVFLKESLKNILRYELIQEFIKKGI